jgi:hypothetical protein
MEEAMSVTVKQLELPHAQLAQYGETDPVALTAVQDALSALWRAASEQAQQEHGEALARACLWNLVAFHSNPQRPRGDSGGEASRIAQVLRQSTASVPARVIHLQEWRDASAPAPGQEVEAWVSTYCLLGQGAPRYVCCEQINLAGYGEKGHSHFPALVRALLVPDLPVGLLWLDDVPRKGRVLGQLLAMSDRMLIDNQHTTDPASLTAVHELLRGAATRVADLSWLRLNPLRHLVAEFFDPPERAAQLAQLERILIETSPEGRNTGLLLAGWLLSRCGFGQVRSVELGNGGTARRWQAQGPQGRSVLLDFLVRDGYGGLDGIFCIQIEAGGDTFALHDVDPEHMSVAGPDRTLPRVTLRENTEPGLLVEALATPLPDPVYTEALATAAALVESDQWNH